MAMRPVGLLHLASRTSPLAPPAKPRGRQGRPPDYSFSKMTKSKIVGVGLNKTGTKTLASCLRHWQLEHASFLPQAFDLWRRGDHAALLGLVAGFDSFEDWPWPLLFREIDAAFPNSRFILTRRTSPEVWLASLCKHAERTGPTPYRQWIYGHAMPQGHERAHIDYYENHLRSVRAYFADRPESLLEVCWEDGSGWSDLAHFLGLPCPDMALPHENRAPA